MPVGNSLPSSLIVLGELPDLAVVTEAVALIWVDASFFGLLVELMGLLGTSAESRQFLLALPRSQPNGWEINFIVSSFSIKRCHERPGIEGGWEGDFQQSGSAACIVVAFFAQALSARWFGVECNLFTDAGDESIVIVRLRSSANDDIALMALILKD